MPCLLRETTEPPAEATCKEPTVVGPENSDDEDILVVSELASPAVAEQMNTFLLLLQTDSKYVWHLSLHDLCTQIPIASTCVV